MSTASARPRRAGKRSCSASIIPPRKSPPTRPLQRSATTSAKRLAKVDLAAPSRPPLRRQRELRQAQQRLQPGLAKILRSPRRCGRIASSVVSRASPPNRAKAMTVIVVRVASAAMSRRSPSLQPRHRRARGLGEHRPLRLDRGGREAGGDDPPLLAPQLAVRGQQAPADDRLEQLLTMSGLGVIGRIVEQHMLHRSGSSRTWTLKPSTRRLK